MSKIQVKTFDGNAAGELELDDAIFGVKVNEHLLWEVVKQQQAKKRVGTHSTKRRDEVRGGGKKPYKQKGTGNARQGSTRAPHFVGGGGVFTPKPRDYEYVLPKKVMAGALRSALSLRHQEQKLVVLDEIELKAIKTQAVKKALDKLGVSSVLIVDGENEKLQKSTRNLQKTKVLKPGGLNVYDVLKHETLILTKATVEAVTTRLGGEA